MKNPKLRINKKTRLTAIRKLKLEVKDIVHSCLLDIEWYIVDDIMKMLKKKGIIYVKKSAKKNKKAKKR